MATAFNTGAAVVGVSLRTAGRHHGLCDHAPMSVHGLGAGRVGGNPSSYTVWGLTNGTSYTFTVAAVNGHLAGPGRGAAAAVVPSGLPAVPAPPSAVGKNAAATVAWTAPSANGSPIVAYAVTPWVNSVPQTPITFNSAATTETVSGLTNGTRYSFAVSAINANGSSLPSGVSPLVMASTFRALPTGLGATAVSGAATVWWTAPDQRPDAITVML